MLFWVSSKSITLAICSEIPMVEPINHTMIRNSKKSRTPLPYHTPANLATAFLAPWELDILAKSPIFVIFSIPLATSFALCYHSSRVASSSLDIRTQILLEEVAKLLSKGLSLEHVAIQADMDEETVARLVSHDAFDGIFASIAPQAHKRWREARQEDLSQRRVKVMAQEDAPEHYKMLRRLVRESAASLSPDSKARILTDLIKMSGALKDESERRVVELSPGQLDWLLEGDKETEEALARLGPSPNRR